MFVLEIKYQKNYFVLLLGLIIFSCSNNQDFKTIDGTCISVPSANIGYSEVKKLYTGETLQIQADYFIEGYVISSEEYGNFFGVLHFQDNEEFPAEGFQIEIDLRDSHLFYPIGSKIVIKLKGLYLGKSKGVYKIGGAFTSFGNISVGRLPATNVAEHVLLSCEEKSYIKPTKVVIPELTKNLSGTLVCFNALEIINYQQELLFADLRKETERILVDCNGNEIALINSGYSDFWNTNLPTGNGIITAVLLHKYNKYHLVVRNTSDLDFSNVRCW